MQRGFEEAAETFILSVSEEEKPSCVVLLEFNSDRLVFEVNQHEGEESYLHQCGRRVF